MEESLIGVLTILSSTYNILLTIIGLTCNLIGAFLLVGINYEYSLKVAEVIKPEFERLDSGLGTLGNQYDDLKAGDDGFDELFSLFPNETGLGIPLDWWTPVRIEAPEDQGGKVTFILAYMGKSHLQTFPIDFLEKASNNHVQKWFIQRALSLLFIGYVFQLAAILLPEIWNFIFHLLMLLTDIIIEMIG